MTYWADLVIEMIPDFLSLDRYFMGRWHLDEPTMFLGTETVTQMCSWGRYDELMFLQDTIPLKAYPAYPLVCRFLQCEWNCHDTPRPCRISQINLS